MRKIAVLFFLAAVCVMGNSNTAHSDVNLNLYLTNIPGESVEATHMNWITVLTWSWQASNPGDAGAGGSASALVRPLMITKFIDKASPLLALHVLIGQHIPEAILTVTAASVSGGYELLRITMEDVIITNISTEGFSNEPGTESVALTFARICYQYTPQKPDGTIGTPIVKCFDVERNIPF